MTEYEYSPDAIRQYLAAQNRVSKWVHRTKRHAPSNPFTPPTRPSSPTKPDCRGSQPQSLSRPASDETYIPQGEAKFSSSNVAPDIEYLHTSSSRSAPSRYTEQSARYAESSYHPHQSITTHHSSLTLTSRHTHKTSKRRTVEARKHRTTTTPHSEKKGYFIHVKGGRTGIILDPLSFKRMEVCVSFSLLLLLFLSWWATSENMCVDPAGLVTHTCSDPGSATISKRDMDSNKKM